MRKSALVLAVVLCMAVVFAACGQNEENVLEDLENVMGNLNSYQGMGTMMIHTGQEPQEYDVEVWFKKPHYYRIALTNKNKDITQIVLRNDEGVFVLTPHLKKSFRFQSDWPEKHGEVYLYQTMVNSVLQDDQRKFVVDKDSKAFVFDLKADYKNRSLARQKIWLNQENYAPQHVEIFDDQNQLIVVLEFTRFEFDKPFEANSFDMERNMTSGILQTLPAMVLDGEMEATADKTNQHFGIIEPAYVPEGVQLAGIDTVTVGEEEAVLLKYSGAYEYSILETRPKAQAVNVHNGSIVDLGYTLGVLTGEASKMLRWTNDGVEFRMTFADLPEEEMVKIAESVQGQIGK